MNPMQNPAMNPVINRAIIPANIPANIPAINPNKNYNNSKKNSTNNSTNNPTKNSTKNHNKNIINPQLDIDTKYKKLIHTRCSNLTLAQQNAIYYYRLDIDKLMRLNNSNYNDPIYNNQKINLYNSGKWINSLKGSIIVGTFFFKTNTNKTKPYKIYLKSDGWFNDINYTNYDIKELTINLKNEIGNPIKNKNGNPIKKKISADYTYTLFQKKNNTNKEKYKKLGYVFEMLFGLPFSNKGTPRFIKNIPIDTYINFN
jgi:hypothetical protein